MKRPEEQTHKLIVEYLRRALPPSAILWHTPSQRGTRKRYEMGILKALGVRAGCPDLFIFHEGKLIGLEIKAPKGRIELNQIIFGDDLVKNGGSWRVVRSVEQAENFLRECGVPLRATVQPDRLRAA